MTNTENCLADVPFRSNGKSARFFNDRVEFNGQSILYNDIETLVTNGATTIHTYFGIPVARSFDGVVSFKMDSGKTHYINMNAMTIFGIPIIRNPRKNEKLYPPLFDAVNSIVAKSMAQKYIDEIKRGATVEVAGLTIDSSEAISKAKASKLGAVINKENYHESRIAHIHSVSVYDKQGEMLWSSSVWSYKNILLIPYILDAIFG